SPLTIPGGDGSLPAGPYTLANDGGTVSVANIPPDLGIVGGSARAYSPTVNPDAFPGEFATREAGFESGLISGGFASVNLLRSDGNGGVEPVSELRDSTGAPVQVLLRFRMDPLDYDVLRDPASLSHLPGYVNRPDTIGVPLYYYDEPSGDWLLSPEFGWLENERGAIPPSELNRIRDGEYEEPVYVAGRVDHFTWYNLDYPESRACLTGRIVDQNNKPVKNAKVVFRSMPRPASNSFFTNVLTTHADENGYLRVTGPRSERNSGDDWNNNNRIDTFEVQGGYSDKDACQIAVFNNNGRGFRMPQYPEADGCGNIGTIRVSLRQAKKEKFSITFTDIERDGQPGRPLFVDPRSVSGLNYAYATLTDLRIPLMGDIWNCTCDNGTTTPDCNRLSTISGSGKASFEIPVLQRDSSDPVQLDELLTGIFSYRKMRPDLGEGGFEFAECAYLTKTKPPKDGDDPIVIECEVEERGQPVIEIVRIEGDTPGLRDFLYDEVVTLEATGRTNRGISIDEFDNFYWTNALETLFIGSRRIFTRPANQLFGTGNGLSIRAHGIDLFGFKGDALETGISVAEVDVVVTASQAFIATGGTTTVSAAVTGAVNTGVRWQSLTPGIASVNNQGEVLGLQPGTARIRAQSLADLSKTDVIELTVIQLVVDFSVSPAAGDSLTEFTFDASSSIGNITAYEWDFGDGNSANGQIVNHMFGASGVFDVTLTVTGDSGLQISRSKQVSTTGRPLVVLTANPQSGVAPLEVSFEGSASVSPTGVISHYNWEFGDGNSSDVADVTHTYVQNGSYYAKLTITDDAENISADSVLIRVVAAPVASFTVTPESGEPPLMVTVDASESVAGEGTIDRFSWDFDDGIIIENGDITETHLYTVPGFYTIRLTVETSLGLLAFAEQEVSVGCDNQFTGNITINSADQLPQFENICQVIGNMTITGLNDITILPEFSNLLSITGNLTINSNSSLSSITGFENLRQVGGLTISNHPELITINAFENLTNGSMDIRSNPKLTSVSGFGRIETAASLILFNNPVLSEIPPFLNLKQVGEFSFGTTAITQISGFNSLTDVNNGITIGGNQSLVSISGFNSLTRIGQLNIDGNPQLSEVSGFDNLETVGGFLQLHNNPVLATIPEFNALRSINTSYFSIRSSAIVTLNGFNNLEHVVGFGILDNPLLQSINGFEKLKRSLGQSGLQIWSNPELVSVQGFTDVEELSRVTILSNPKLTSFTGLNKLSRVSGNFSVTDIPQLAELNAFAQLEDVRGQFRFENTGYSACNILDIYFRILDGAGFGTPNAIVITGNPDTRATPITIVTQQHIDELAGICLVNGNVTFFTELSQISGLESLRRINGTLSINRSPNITDLSFLPNLRQTETFSLSDNASLQSLGGLESLRQTGSIGVNGNTSLQSLGGLDSLRRANSISIQNQPLITDIDVLSGIRLTNGSWTIRETGIVQLPDFQYTTPATGTGPSFTIQDNPSITNLDAFEVYTRLTGFTFQNNPSLVSIQGLQNVTNIGNGLVTIRNNPALASLEGMHNIESTSNTSGIILDGNGITDLNGLRGLKTLGILRIENSPALQSLAGLSNLTTVNSVLTISGNPLLENLNGLESVQTVAGTGTIGDLNITNNAALENINALSSLIFTRRIQIQNNPGLVNLDGLENMARPLILLRVDNNSALQNIDGLRGVTAISQQLFITNNAQLQHVDGLSGITLVNNELNISNNPQLQHLDGLSGLSGNITTVEITQNPLLTSISGLTGMTGASFINIRNNGIVTLNGLNNLTSVSTMNVMNNPALEHMDDVSALERVLNSIRVSDNEMLKRVSGMTSLARVSSIFRISDNPVLPLCDVQALVDQIQSREGIGFSINISNNDADGSCDP
ncbi:MAG: PKD domain-containing protein, partial [Balneolaceae bacterium]